MKLLIESLKRTPVFSHLNYQQIESLVRRATVHVLPAGTAITPPENPVNHHLLVLDGNIKTLNPWLFYGNEMQYCWQLRSDESDNRFSTLSSATRAINATTTTKTRLLFINGDDVDNLQSRNSSNNHRYFTEPERQY